MTWRSSLAALALVGLFGSAAQAETFQLSGVRFTPSIYLEDVALQAAVAPFLNRPIELSDVQEMTEAVQALYTRAGILTARVLLQPQTVTDGVLELTLLEATVDRLSYSGLEATDDAFLRRAISLREGQAPDYDQLERDLRIFEIMYDFVPQLQFSEGGAFGTVNATITGDPPERNSWRGSFDNYGSENTGEYRLTLTGRLPNLTGVRDAAFLQVQLSEGEQSFDITYTRPVGGGGGVAYVSGDYSQSEIVEGDFAALELESDSYGLTLGYRRPFRIRPATHWLVDTFVTAETSSSQLVSLDFQEIDLVEAGVQVSYQRIGNGTSFTALLGIKSGSADALRTTEAEGSYTLAYGTLGYARTVGQNGLFDLSLAFQAAPDQNLPGPRLFSAGGATTVRGYPVDIRNGDSGAVMRTQYAMREPRPFGGFEGDWTPFGFLDLGVVVPFRETESFNFDDDGLVSLGAGVRATFHQNVAAVAFLAVPVQETEGFDDVGEAVFSFGLDYNF